MAHNIGWKQLQDNARREPHVPAWKILGCAVLIALAAYASVLLGSAYIHIFP